MKKMSLQRKSCVMPVAVAAGFGMAGMGLVSSGVVVADTTSVTDTINVTVQPSCTFNNAEDKTYIGSAANGTEVGNFNDSGVHEFNLFCNDNNGFIVTATPYDLEATGIEDVISYTDNYTHTGVDSMWSAAITSDATGVTVVPVVPVGGGTILSSDTSTATAGVDFSATYSAYVGTETPAGTYTGTIVYTLTASGTSNSGNSGSGGGSSVDSGNDATNNTNNGGSGSNMNNSGSGDAGTNNINSGSTNGTQSNTQNTVPRTLNNTYNTYSTTNNYNTANYASGGASTPAVASTQNLASADGGSGSVNGDDSGDNDDAEASDSYKNPLGVTTRTSSSSSEGNSEMDWMPIVATGALVVAGVATAALIRSNKEEEA